MKRAAVLCAPAFALACLLIDAPFAAAQAAPTSAGAERNDVTMYVMPQCGYCEQARRHLKRAGVAWRELDISEPAILEEFKAKGGTGTPLLVVGDDVISGYRSDALDAALARRSASLKNE